MNFSFIFFYFENQMLMQNLINFLLLLIIGSPLLRDTKSESCSSPSDETGVINNTSSGSFSVIFRPGETPITPTSEHDTLSSHRYSTHTASRLSGIHSRPDEGNYKAFLSSIFWWRKKKSSNQNFIFTTKFLLFWCFFFILLHILLHNSPCTNKYANA